MPARINAATALCTRPCLAGRSSRLSGWRRLVASLNLQNDLHTRIARPLSLAFNASSKLRSDLELPTSIRFLSSSSVGPAGNFHPPRTDGLNVALDQIPSFWLIRTQARSKHESAPGYYFSLGRSYAKFYWEGIKHIIGNAREGREIQHNKEFDLKAALRNAAPGKKLSMPADLSRAEFQYVVRSRHDGMRLPLLGLMFAVCGEFLPLVIMVFRKRIVPVLPQTCRTPQQQLDVLAHRLEKKQALLQQWAVKSLDELRKRSERNYMMLHCQVLGLGPLLVPHFVLPTSVLAGMVERQRAYERLDNALIRRNGGAARLSSWELILAWTERAVAFPQTNKIQDSLKLLKKGPRDEKLKSELARNFQAYLKAQPED